jgi:poly(glycerol-phosphate) alpha-glucosyltransferase
MPEPKGEPPPRDPNQVTMVARLEKQKRIGHAIRAVAKAHETVPTVRLDIFGAGSQRAFLEDLVARLDATDFVTLRGHDPAARDSLWTSSAFLMTSLFEGYPLSTLESLSHGCPVVSYDIKYGPREQITDEVDGFLVPNRAINQVADRIVRLLQDPGLVSRMSKAAQEKARDHGHGRFLDEWRQVIEKAVELKPFRTRLDEVSLEVLQLDVSGPLRPAVGFRPVSVSRRGKLTFEGRLHVSGSSERSTLESAQVSLTAIHEGTGMSVELPLSVGRSDGVFALSSTMRFADMFGEDDDLSGVRLRLRLVWQNSTWNTMVARPEERPAGVEASYQDDGTLLLSVR